MLEIATLDYGSDDIIFEMEMDISYMPEYPAMMPNSVAISPSLPAGLTLNTTTGEISGRVTSTDFAGSNYIISTTSGVEAWSGNITIKSTMENPLYTGYENLFTGGYSDQTSAKTAFASNGEIVTLERYTSTSSILVDGIAAGGNHDSNDIVLSIREPNGDYIWAKSIRGNGFYIEDVDVDEDGDGRRDAPRINHHIHRLLRITILRLLVVILLLRMLPLRSLRIIIRSLRIICI